MREDVYVLLTQRYPIEILSERMLSQSELNVKVKGGRPSVVQHTHLLQKRPFTPD